MVKQAKREETGESDARYRGLLEAAPDAMVVVNQAGDIVLLNLQAEKQFGYSRDELVGQPVTNIIPEGFAERLIADDLRSAADALAQQIGTGIELSGRRKDGTDFPIEIMLSPLESAEGILVTAAIRDISVRKAAENQLLQAQKLESIGRLAGGIAHDFNNMLFAIHGYAELLTQDLASGESDSLRSRQRAAQRPGDQRRSRASRHADRAAAGVQPPAGRHHESARHQRSGHGDRADAESAHRRERRACLKLDPAAGHIRADAGQIDQIIVNLVVNARDAMPERRDGHDRDRQRLDLMSATRWSTLR